MKIKLDDWVAFWKQRKKTVGMYTIGKVTQISDEKSKRLKETVGNYCDLLTTAGPVCQEHVLEVRRGK